MSAETKVIIDNELGKNFFIWRGTELGGTWSSVQYALEHCCAAQTTVFLDRYYRWMTVRRGYDSASSIRWLERCSQNMHHLDPIIVQRIERWVADAEVKHGT